jgi:hypothetical protein
MQIDESDEQDENAYPSIRKTLHSDSKITLETNLFLQNQRQPSVSIKSGIMIAAECPKHLMIDVHSKFTKNSPTILKAQFPSAIEISSRFVLSKVPSPIPESVAGMQIDERDEQNSNANCSIRESLQPDSNVTLESASHQLKQNSQRSSTHDGMEIDESDEQDQNAHFSSRESLQSDPNITLESALHS